MKLSGNRRRKDCLFWTNLLKFIYLTYLIVSIYENYAVYRRTNYNQMRFVFANCTKSNPKKNTSRSLKRTEAFKMWSKITTIVHAMCKVCVRDKRKSELIRFSFSRQSSWYRRFPRIKLIIIAEFRKKKKEKKNKRKACTHYVDRHDRDSFNKHATILRPIKISLFLLLFFIL